MKNVLTIAGSDSCGGAGIQADLKTMCALGVYGMSVITAVTAQNTLGVKSAVEMDKTIVEEQIRCIFDDIKVDAVKIGMVSNVEIIKTIRNLLIEYKAENVVIDPVMISKSGYLLLKPEALKEMKKFLSSSYLITPNIPEAEVLADIKIQSEKDIEQAAINIYNIGAKNVLIKGGHRSSETNCVNDILYDGEKFTIIEGQRVNKTNTHGTGCTLSSAIASFLAKGNTIEESVKLAKNYITKAIENSFSIGHGVGPLGHLTELYKSSGIQ